MPARAVVFDFYGTLSVSASRAERREGAARIAAALGIPSDALHEVIAATFTERATGACGNLEDTMRWLAERCGYTPAVEQLQTACEIRRATEDVYARALRPDAEPTLRALHQQGIKVGLLSDCTHELPEIWPSLPLARYVDATVFSVEARFRKPHPQLYDTVARLLGVAAPECLYVGDGGSGELTGALKAGMVPIHLRTADAADAIIYDAEPTWAGATITTLSDVLTLLQPSPATWL
jgi:putative hydrolase of the HAD superfamily